MSLLAAPIKTGPGPAPSSTSSQSKLTKKQKKALSFRERKSSGKSSKKEPQALPDIEDDNELAQMDTIPVSLVEDADKSRGSSSAVQVAGILDSQKGKSGNTKRDPGDKGKGKRAGGNGKEEVEDASEVGKAKKRKREEEQGMVVDGDAEEKEGKSRNKKVKTGREGEENGDGGEEKSSGRKGGKQRFILFVGNFAYTTQKAAIEAHFAACDPPPEVRLLTPKPRLGVPMKAKSKGCAFLEFKTKAALQQALKLHQSMLDGRMINVELTAGGGGKSQARLQKVKERNKALLNQRQKKSEIASKKPSDTIPSRPDRPQRFSTTSGLDEAPSTKRTWSVGDQIEETTHRGGKKHTQQGAKKRKAPRPGAAWGTGVNAIPVG